MQLDSYCCAWDSMHYLPNTCTTVSEPINKVWSSPCSDSFFLLEGYCLWRIEWSGKVISNIQQRIFSTLTCSYHRFYCKCVARLHHSNRFIFYKTQVSNAKAYLMVFNSLTLESRKARSLRLELESLTITGSFLTFSDYNNQLYLHINSLKSLFPSLFPRI